MSGYKDSKTEPKQIGERFDLSNSSGTRATTGQLERQRAMFLSISMQSIFSFPYIVEKQGQTRQGPEIERQPAMFLSTLTAILSYQR